MLDTLTTENSPDFRQRYNKTYGWLNNSDTLVYITDVRDDKLTFDTMDGEGYFAYANSKVDFKFVPITRGWFLTEQYGPVLLTRIPARQWQRGIARANTSVQYVAPPTNALLSLNITLEIVNDVFVKKLTCDLQKFLDKKTPYYIINKFFMLYNGDVFFYDKVVGKYKDRTITKLEEVVEQELRDAISRNTLPFEIKNV